MATRGRKSKSPRILRATGFPVFANPSGGKHPPCPCMIQQTSSTGGGKGIDSLSSRRRATDSSRPSTAALTPHFEVTAASSLRGEADIRPSQEVAYKVVVSDHLDAGGQRHELPRAREGAEYPLQMQRILVTGYMKPEMLMRSVRRGGAFSLPAQAGHVGRTDQGRPGGVLRSGRREPERDVQGHRRGTEAGRACPRSCLWTTSPSSLDSLGQELAGDPAGLYTRILGGGGGSSLAARHYDVIVCDHSLLPGEQGLDFLDPGLRDAALHEAGS